MPPLRHFAVSGWVVIAGLAMLLPGCDSRPSAPALEDGEICNKEGFRFLVPEGWLQSASGILPRGQLEGEVLLVQYKMRTPVRGASVEVLCFNDDLTTDLPKYHAETSHGKGWKPQKPAEQLEINGTRAERFIYVEEVRGRKEPKEKMIKEVVAFSRPEMGRIYNFIGLFYASDEKARQQLRRAIDSIIWK